MPRMRGDACGARGADEAYVVRGEWLRDSCASAAAGRFERSVDAPNPDPDPIKVAGKVVGVRAGSD